MSSVPLYRCPRRFLFIASIGNPAPYTGTRHSAGHVLLDALQAPLQERIGLTSNDSGNNSKSIFYTMWKSPALMNVSGPPVLRQFKNWFANRQQVFDTIFAPASRPASTPPAPAPAASEKETETEAEVQTKRLFKGSSLTPIDVSTRELTRFRPTLVILHDELEAAPGKVKVRMGGPEQSSLRGHRGLISIIDSFRGARLLTPKREGPAGVSVLRIGIGIGRPVSRERDAVSDYVLGKLSPRDLEAMQRAVPEVVDLLVKEMYRDGDD
jgi:PTH1 family peptidyl-tRNA hydrolase